MKNPKFRVWNNKSNRIWNVDEIIWNDKGDCHPVLYKSYLIYSDNDKLMQWSGLYDVDGREIFEGDIVEFTTFDSIDYVIFDAPQFKTVHHSLQGYECRIIGNIYENPELLKIQPTTPHTSP